jgi:hypothetical protein
LDHRRAAADYEVEIEGGAPLWAVAASLKPAMCISTNSSGHLLRIAGASPLLSSRLAAKCLSTKSRGWLGCHEDTQTASSTLTHSPFNPFRDTARVLRMTRYFVGWGATGVQMGAFEHTVKYTQDRLQFGKSIASFQMVQDLLAKMLANVTACQRMMARLAQMDDEGKLGDHHSACDPERARWQDRLCHSQCRALAHPSCRCPERSGSPLPVCRRFMGPYP